MLPHVSDERRLHLRGTARHLSTRLQIRVRTLGVPLKHHKRCDHSHVHKFNEARLVCNLEPSSCNQLSKIVLCMYDGCATQQTTVHPLSAKALQSELLQQSTALQCMTSCIQTCLPPAQLQAFHHHLHSNIISDKKSAEPLTSPTTTVHTVVSCGEDSLGSAIQSMDPAYQHHR
jgi:hypothetical protein